MWIEREVLIAVKAYPEPSSTYKETCCTAAISKEDGWLRLYPIQFRQLPSKRQFRKYQLVRLRMARHQRDRRPESFRPDQDSLLPGRVLGTHNAWAERQQWVMPTLSRSMCEIRAKQEAHQTSLGVFKPREVVALKIKDVGSEWSGRQRAKVSQLWFDDLRGATRIEKIPFAFSYRYLCDEEGCKGHSQKIVDWELMQLYRRLRTRRMSPDAIIKKIRQKYLEELCGPAKDTHFFVGNHSRYRKSFMVLGVFWPPKSPPSLFPQA